MNEKLIKTAFLLSLITIIYNIAEGLISVYFGYSNDTLALFGFGADSFVEVISGVAIVHMIMRMRFSQVKFRDQFEKTALKITGISFFLLSLGLLVGVAINIITNSTPETTLPGTIIAVISIITMFYLMKAKLNAGKKLRSDAIIADANCTKTCFHLSLILLASSLLYEAFSINYIDSIGSLGIAWFAFSEGKEAIEKSRSNSTSCDCRGK